MSPLPNKLAEAPFDDAQADLILQSSDEVQFRVFKNILSLTSPIFTDMFSIPSPPSQNPHDEIQVVPVSEDSIALDVALRHIYPVRNPKGDTLHFASILAEFARKYQVDALDTFITSYLTESVERDPVGVYSIAVTYGYNSIGTNAARLCRNLPFSGLQSPYLGCISAEHISELHRYHVACGEAASALAVSNRTWFAPLSQNWITHPQIGSRCPSCSIRDIVYVTSDPSDTDRFHGSRCVWHYLLRSALVLAHHPTAKTITEEAFVLKNNDCDSCSHNMRGRMLEISIAFGKEIKNAVEQVSLLLSRCPTFAMYMFIRSRFLYPRLFPWDRVAPPPLPLQIIQ